MIGLITLGHSPRPDHEEVYNLIAPGVPRMLVGALDAMSCDEARTLEDKEGVSPLVCLLKPQSFNHEEKGNCSATAQFQKT